MITLVSVTECRLPATLWSHAPSISVGRALGFRGRRPAGMPTIQPSADVGTPQYLEHRGAPRHASDGHRHVWLRYSTEWFRGDRPPWMRRRATRARAAGRRFIGGDVVVVGRAAVEGLGIAMLPSHVVAADVAAGRLVRILEHWPVPTRNPSAIMPLAVRSDDGVRRPPGWR
jgi:DNA-binding transcriptional LysR family regulator